MTSDEFVVMGIWILRILIYGFLGALAMGILWVTLRTLNNSLRSRGIMGLILCMFQIAIIICIILVGLYYANQTGILQTVIAWLP